MASRDAGHVVVFEAVILALLLVGSVGYVTLFRDVPDSGTSMALDVRLAGEDALNVLAGLDGCAGFLDVSREAACAAAHGRSAFTRFVTDALAGNATNLSLRVDTLVSGAIAWNAYVDTGGAARLVVENGAPAGERVTTALSFAPEWNLTWLAPAQTPASASATSGYDDALWWALPLWKSRALAAADGVGAVTMQYPNGDVVTFGDALVDASRGSRWTRAHYAFDEGAGTTTTESRTGTSFAVHAARWVPDGHTGSALAFQGPGSALTLTHARLLPSESLTLGAWMRPLALPTGDADVVTWVAGGDVVTLAHRADGTLTALVETPGESTRVTSPAPLALDQWAHVAVAVDADEVRLFVDGARVARGALPDALADATPPTLTVGHDSSGSSAPVDADLDRVTATALALTEDEWSALRRATVPRAQVGVPGWDATTGSPRVVDAAFTHAGSAFTGRESYDVSPATGLADHALTLNAGVNASVAAAYHNATGARVVPKGATVALEADWDPLIRALGDAGVATGDPVTTITVRAPVTQPFESRGPGLEVVNATVGTTIGFTNLTVPEDWLLGAHTLVAHLDVDVTTATGTERVRFTLLDYFSVTTRGSTTVPLNPLYRAVLELWVPEWG